MDYELQVKRKRHPDFCFFGQFNAHGPMNYSSSKLFQAVYKAVVTHELFYSSDVYAFVCDELIGLTEQVINENYKDTPVEHGLLGMDIYYMRKQVLEVWLGRIANREAIQHYKLVIGDRVRKLQYSTHTFSTAIITDIDYAHGLLTLHCKKRGTRSQWTLTIDANHPGLIQALSKQQLPSCIKHKSDSDGVDTFIIDLGNQDQLFFKPPQTAI